MKTAILAASTLATIGALLANNATDVAPWVSAGVNVLLGWYLVHDVRVERPRLDTEHRNERLKMVEEFNQQLSRQAEFYERFIENAGPN